jgi:hypothetical protein
MGIEVIQHSGDARGMRIADIHQLLDVVRPVHRGSLLGHIHLALPAQGFKEQEPVANAVALILEVILLRLPGLAG